MRLCVNKSIFILSFVGLMGCVGTMSTPDEQLSDIDRQLAQLNLQSDDVCAELTDICTVARDLCHGGTYKRNRNECDSLLSDCDRFTQKYCDGSEPDPSCGDGTCDTGVGEDCSTCESDCGTCPEPMPDPDPSLLFVGDAETGDASQWCHVHSAAPAGVVTSPVRDGNYAFVSRTEDGQEIYDTERSEFANGPKLCGNHTYQEGDENFTAVSVYLEKNFPYYDHWSLVTQFKAPFKGTPPMQISLARDKWEIVGDGRVSPRPRWFIADVQRGIWNDFVVHAKWSADPKVGWFEVYHQGKLVIPKTYTNTMNLDDGYPTPLFLSVGHYRDTSPTSGSATLYIDAVKVGPTLQSVSP